MSIESNVCDAIELLVDNAVAKAQYDKTIQGTVIKCIDATIGKYLIKYQDSTFNAYASGSGVSYPDGTGVYILVPGNDMSRDKTIRLILAIVKRFVFTLSKNSSREVAPLAE